MCTRVHVHVHVQLSIHVLQFGIVYFLPLAGFVVPSRQPDSYIITASHLLATFLESEFIQFWWRGLKRNFLLFNGLV